MKARGQRNCNLYSAEIKNIYINPEFFTNRKYPSKKEGKIKFPNQQNREVVLANLHYKKC